MAIRCLNAKRGKGYDAINGDCVDVVRQLPDHSIGFSVYSPPFSNVFVYSDSAADMGNSANDIEFQQHYGYLLDEMTRVTKPGRLSAVHCSDLPLSKWKDGVIGIKDFSGDIIRAHQDRGWILHSRVTIWRDPVVEMTRTKALGLLYKQLIKDSTRSRQGMADYLMVFRAPGENAEPVGHDKVNFPVDKWQQWASPVWMDIRQTDTLNVKMARDGADERHLCPLQLDLIERAVVMWSNKGDVVLSPFMGIGSEGFVALRLGRKFVGVELKESYWRYACKHLDASESTSASLFDILENPTEASDAT
jgi:DNA modification methylase